MLIIFDFDGVLADSFPEVYRLNRDAFKMLGQKLTERGYQDLFLRNINQSLKEQFKNPSDLARLKAFKKKAFGRYYGRVKFFSGAKDLVKSLKRVAPLSIVSSTRRIHITRILSRYGVLKSFQSIWGSEAESKREELVAALKRARVKAEEACFITDTLGDIRIAKELGIMPLAVSWGFHPARLLKKERPAKLFRRMKDLKAYFLSGKKKLL